jgi:hypothetical protein
MLPQATLADEAKALEKFPSIESLRFANPILTLPNQVATGTNFVGRPATAPNVVEDYNGRRFAVNPDTREVTPLQGSELPAGENLAYLVSTLLRNFTKAGALERWMPKRPYDTRIFTPDATAKAKPEEYIFQNMGFGNVTKAFKKPNVDTERILKRYDKKLQP